MAEDELVLRVARSDRDHVSFVLLKIAKNGSRALDLKLVGTEGENAYSGVIKHNRLHQLRAHNFKGTDEEWENVLHALLRKEPRGDILQERDELEIVASVADDDHMSIIFRKNISGIAQRLGTISLKQSEEEILLFDWCGAAAQAAADASQQIASLQTKFETQQETVKKLNEQLQELIKAKQEHEDALLQKFSELLNSKKLKIRDQQRLLAGAKVDPVAAEQVQTARQTTRNKKAGPSRVSKRKASAKATVEESESEGFDDRDHMQLDKNKAEEQNEIEDEAQEAATPERSDLDETEDEDDLDIQSQLSKRGVGSKGKAIETAKQKLDEQTMEDPPPRRELPFAKHNLRNSKPADEVPEHAGEDDDTDDGEL